MIHTKLRNVLTLTLFVALNTVVALNLLKPVNVLAAPFPPGCYLLQQGDGKYHPTDRCTDEEKSAITARGACFFGVSVPKQTGVDFKEEGCGAHDDKLLFVDKGEGGGFVLNPVGECDAEAGDCITDDIQLAINGLSIGVGIVITISIVIAALQYMTARDNPQAVQAAKTRITNGIIAILAFVFIYAVLQWLVPGGIF